MPGSKHDPNFLNPDLHMETIRSTCNQFVKMAY